MVNGVPCSGSARTAWPATSWNPRPALEQLGQLPVPPGLGRKYGLCGRGGRGHALAGGGEHLAAFAHDQDLAHGPCDLTQQPVQVVVQQDVGADHPHEAVAGIDRCGMAHHGPGAARVRA